MILLYYQQSSVQTGRTVHQIPCRAAMNSVEWNPKYNLLAYAGDDKNKYQADEGTLFALISFSCQVSCFIWILGTGYSVTRLLSTLLPVTPLTDSDLLQITFKL